MTPRQEASARFRAEQQNAIVAFQLRAGAEVPGISMGVDTVEAQRLYTQWLEDHGLPVVALDMASARKLAAAEAKVAYDWALVEMGLPPFPFDIPDNILTAEGARDFAYATGKPFLEGLLEAETGIPISLPQKLTAKEIARSITSIIPTDVDALINTSLNVATQAAASGISSLLAGAGIGSAVPGLGTVVGIATALAVAALRSALREDPEGYQVVCTTPMPCHLPLPTYTPMDLLPWIMTERVRLTWAITREQASRYCGRGPIVQCDTWLANLGNETFRLIEDTPSVLGLPQLERLIPYYEQAPREIDYYHPTEHRIVKEHPRNSVDLLTILARMKTRRAQLLELVAAGDSIETTTDPFDFRFVLVTAIREASVQFQNQPSAENLEWLNRLAGYMARLSVREDADRAAALAHTLYIEQRAAQIAADPQLQAQAEREGLSFRCQDGHEPSCQALRDLDAAAAAAAQRAQQSQALMASQAMTRAESCNAAYDQWLLDNPFYAKCLEDADRIVFVQFCTGQRTVGYTVETGNWDSHTRRRCGVPPAKSKAPYIAAGTTLVVGGGWLLARELGWTLLGALRR